jgi:zinc protease
LSEQVQALAFGAHPYRFPTIGLAADIRAWTAHDLRVFYRTYYAPNNQTFVLAGDISAGEAFELARRHLEPVPRQVEPPRVGLREPQQRAQRQVIVRRPGQSALLQYAYKAPAAADPRGPALNLLLTALVDGNASRLHRVLVERRGLAIDVGGDWRQGFDPSLCWLYFTLAEGVDAHAAHKIIDGELSRVAERGLSEAELRRARNVAEAAFWKQLSTLDGKAQLLGEYEVLRGGWRRLFEQPGCCRAVTRAEVAQVARTVLDPRRRTVGMSIPQAVAA